MTPRIDVEWIDIEDDRDEILKDIRQCRHEQLLVGSGGIDAPLGMILKKDLLDQTLDGKPLDPMAALREPLVVHEATPIFKVLEQFKKAPARLAMIFDEYGALEGIVTQTDLLEAIAGDLPSAEGEEPNVVERDDGSLLINGMMPAEDAFSRLRLRTRPEEGDFHTVAGFVLGQLGHLPEVGEHFEYEGWRFEVVDLDGRRIDKVLAIPPKAKPDNAQ
jgi:putative hemolysin